MFEELFCSLDVANDPETDARLTLGRSLRPDGFDRNTDV